MGKEKRERKRKEPNKTWTFDLIKSLFECYIQNGFNSKWSLIYDKNKKLFGELDGNKIGDKARQLGLNLKKDKKSVLALLDDVKEKMDQIKPLSSLYKEKMTGGNQQLFSDTNLNDDNSEDNFFEDKEDEEEEKEEAKSNTKSTIFTPSATYLEYKERGFRIPIHILDRKEEIILAFQKVCGVKLSLMFNSNSIIIRTFTRYNMQGINRNSFGKI